MEDLSYWQERALKSQDKLTEKGIKETEKQLVKYYQQSRDKVVKGFEDLYNKYRLNLQKGIAPTPADLYRMENYWEMQGVLQKELQKLGDKQAALFGKNFTNHYYQIYRGLLPNDDLFFSEISLEYAQQMINQVWCADGKTWSSRIWKNTERLQQVLNDNLLECVLTGADTNALKKRLQYQFGVSYNSADTIVRTEMLHIQTQAAQQKYKDVGVQEVEVWADKDERRCEICGKLHQKRFPIGGTMPIPAHPRCRCRILPVVETKVEQLKIEGFE